MTHKDFFDESVWEGVDAVQATAVVAAWAARNMEEKTWEAFKDVLRTYQSPVMDWFIFSGLVDTAKAYYRVNTDEQI